MCNKFHSRLHFPEIETELSPDWWLAAGNSPGSGQTQAPAVTLA